VLEVEDPDKIVVTNGFARARYVGTGFLMIGRQVLERMCAHYRSLQFFREHSSDALAGNPRRFALFECLIEPQLSQRGFQLLQDWRRDLGRSGEPAQSRWSDDFPGRGCDPILCTGRDR
jgi:hypothetical protein